MPEKEHPVTLPADERGFEACLRRKPRVRKPGGATLRRPASATFWGISYFAGASVK
jgi:hypothetical protein